MKGWTLIDDMLTVSVEAAHLLPGQVLRAKSQWGVAYYGCPGALAIRFLSGSYWAFSVGTINDVPHHDRSMRCVACRRQLSEHSRAWP